MANKVLFKPTVLSTDDADGNSDVKTIAYVSRNKFPDVNLLTFEEERQLNDPTISLEYVADKYRETWKPHEGHGLYEWEPIEFANVEVVQRAAQHFKKYKRYNDIDESSRLWTKWWDREEYRRKHGITLPIKSPPGGGISDRDLLPVWIPGPYYGHLNYGPIKRTIDPNESDIRRALSNTSEEKERLDKEEKKRNMLAGLSNKTVASKDYDFPDFWDGHYQTYLATYFAAELGLDIGVLKGRRKGFSYIGAWQAFNVYDLFPASLVLLIAHDLKFLNKGKEALFNMVKSYSDFINANTDWKKNRLVDNTTEMKSGYNINGVDGEFGFLSQVLCLSAADNPNCARGKDATLILYEESGSFPNLTETRNATKAAAETGGYVVGQSLYWGTVGKNSNDMDGLTNIFYNPYSADCLPFKNIWSENPESDTCALFFGQYQNLLGAIDKNGNSNFTKAREIDDLQDRIKQKGDKYHQWRAERPRNPEEALSPSTNNLFKQYQPIIGTQLEKLQTTHMHFGRNGQYRVKGNRVVFVSNEELKQKGEVVHPPINDLDKFLGKDTDRHGCIVEWDVPFTIYEESPINRNLGQVMIENYIPDNLYVAWHDPFATNREDEEITFDDSSGVTYIYEIPNNITKSRGGKIVASWIGRPHTTDAYNEQLFLMLRRWNAKMLYENDRGVVYEYAQPRKLTRWLIEEPELLSMKEIGGKTGRKYGISMAPPGRKIKGLTLLHDFFRHPLSTDEFGNSITFLDNFYCRRGLKEILAFNSKGNFDCISTLIVGMFYIKDTMDIELLEREPNLNLDDFWERSHF